MPERPLIILGNPEPVERPKKSSMFGGNPSPTNKIGQAQRIEQQFSNMQAAFISEQPTGDIEKVLVMETSAQIDKVRNAANKIKGFEWLAEIDVDDIELHDLYSEEDAKKIKGGRFYLLASNKQALDKLLSLWNKYKSGKKLAHGYGPFSNLFEYLITLRFWDIRDRIKDTGILDIWKDEYESKQETASILNFEIELHYHQSEQKRNQKLSELIRNIESEDGRANQSICINEIAFHALKVTLPVDSVKQIAEHDWELPETPHHLSPIFNSETIRYFRPIGQHINPGQEIPQQEENKILPPVNNELPVIALLDGAPLLRHQYLADRIVLHDPDNYMETYQPPQQEHGTSMASLICHGDLSQPSTARKSLTRRIYVRPVMQPDSKSIEMIPAESFQEDIIERAVREMFEEDVGATTAIKVINLSIGNIEQHYLHEISPWARLLDWLSFKYQVLFIVSAGNYTGDILLPPNDGDGTDTQKRIISAIDKNQRNHRLLSPAESINTLTVGALQSDFFGEVNENIRGFDPMDSESLPASYSLPESQQLLFPPMDSTGLPAPYSRIGAGYRGMIKPEIFTQGGRLLYDRDPSNADSLTLVQSSEPPGVQTAYPGARPEQLTNTAYTSGTSNAAAITSHGAGHIYEMLEELREEHSDRLPHNYDAVLIKTLLVHSAFQGNNKEAYTHLKNSTNTYTFSRYCSKFLGYGNINIDRVLECTQTRATAIGYGTIQTGERHRFLFPLPIGYSIQDYLRITITLAWFSPVNPFHIGFRRAKMFVENEYLKGKNGHHRIGNIDGQQARKGTVQHEIFELKKDNLPGNSLELFVECAEDAGSLDDEISYGLAVTLEIAPNEAIDLYQMVREKISQSVQVSG